MHEILVDAYTLLLDFADRQRPRLPQLSGRWMAGTSSPPTPRSNWDGINANLPKDGD
ncbi:MAG: hypothetical protein P8Y42_15830 [Exilibacterium sp.]